MLDSIPFAGGIYNNKNAKELLNEISSVSRIPFEISQNFDNVTVSGYIPYTTCREALMHVAFAIKAVVDTSGSKNVMVYSLDDETKQVIPSSRIMRGQNFESDTRVTAVEVFCHGYTPSSKVVEVYNAYQSGYGENILVRFNEPIHGLEITDGDIISSGTNFAIINAGANCVMVGNQYDHTVVIHRKENPLVLSTDIENVISIQNATLVSSKNVDNIIEICYNYFVNTEKTNFKIIDGKTDKRTNVGDTIEYDTEYLNTLRGVIIKQVFGLNGGILIKDSIVKQL